MDITIGGYVAFDDDMQSILAVGATAADAIASIEEDDKELAPFSTLPASAALIADFEETGPGGPTWLTVSTDLGEVACLEEES